jgi:hypothetical protein
MPAAPVGVALRPQPPRSMALRVADPTAYAAQKAAANAAAARLVRRGPAAGRAVSTPKVVRKWTGLTDPSVAPSDSTGAIGTQRYVELVNDMAAVYNRTSAAPLAFGPLTDITGCATVSCGSDSVTDPQVIWDPATSRFYYTAIDPISSTQNLMDFGFSISPTPDLSPASWCRYSIDFGSIIPDYPKLGDTRDFLLIGTNNFNPDLYVGSTIEWVTKPPSGSTCPAPNTLMSGQSPVLQNADGSSAWTPVPANQVGASSTGWAVAIPASYPTTGATFLTLFEVTKTASGGAIIPAMGVSVPVAAFNVPASAAQQGTVNQLDTLDGRMTQAIEAIDPAHHGQRALWTQHTVFGGAGAQVRWYEINPVKRTLIQHGTITKSTLFTFNAAISPDRLVRGKTDKFGGDMVIEFNQSSAATLPDIAIAAKVGSTAISAPHVLVTSAGADNGFDCGLLITNLCRWGDYSGVTPDPGARTSSTTGLVWGTNMLANGVGANSADWTTLNFVIKP